MAFVVDASVTLPWFLEDERTRFTDSLLDAIGQVEYWAPSVWSLEVANALLNAERRPDRRRGPRGRVGPVGEVANQDRGRGA